MACGLLIMSAVPAHAQDKERVRTGQPVLIDDTRAGKVGAEGLQDEYASVTDRAEGLSKAQIEKILRIEKCRNKKLKQLDDAIKRQKQLLKEAGQDKKKTVRALNKISDLSVRKQNVITKAREKIKKIFTAN